jgi:hypothetical protein
MAKRRPFHETIVDAIRRARNSDQMDCLGALIMETKISENHDEIMAQWLCQRRRIGCSFDGLGCLEAQKREAEAEAEEKAAAERLLGSPKKLDDLAERLEMPHEPFEL